MFCIITQNDKTFSIYVRIQISITQQANKFNFVINTLTGKVGRVFSEFGDLDIENNRWMI